jgi:hypothetical protein
MSQNAAQLRQQAAEFRRLASSFSTLEMRKRLFDLAETCDRIANDIERAVNARREA